MRRAATAAWQVLRKAKPVVTPAFAAAGAAAFFQSSAYAHSPPPSSYAPGPAVAAEEEYEEGVPKGEDVPGHGVDKSLPRIPAPWTHVPEVPPPVGTRGPAHLVMQMDTTVEIGPLTASGEKFAFWTFIGRAPGPFIRACVGDVLEIQYDNLDQNGLGHNIDFHAINGPGGGAPALYAEAEQRRVGVFKLLTPGLYIYHCAAAPVPMHIANGMYGLILVEPEGGLPPVDKEFAVIQSEWYAEPQAATESPMAHGRVSGGAAATAKPADPLQDPDLLVTSYASGLAEKPSQVTFNGREGALTDKPLLCRQGDRVRLFFGNAGPNLVSSFHVIGQIFDKVYREGDLISPPARGIQTTLVPAGGSAVVEMDTTVPGSFTLVDHSIFRIDKGAVGFLKVLGKDPRHDIYASEGPPVFCPGCKLHN